MPGIKGMPVPAKIGFEPGTEIHWIGISRNANITQIARAVARGDIHSAAQGNCKVGKIAADANALAKTIQSGAIGASFQIIEAEMAMDEIANAACTRAHPAGVGPKVCQAKSSSSLSTLQ
jgi:hypothetical protein